ncbi:MAG: peptidase C39 [Brevundimonas sp.]|nr:MAG: peptidase C39 [Brevundimonas sp.]
MRAALACLFLAAAPSAHAQVELNGPTGPMSIRVVSYRDIPFRTVVRQQYDFSCGSAALATLLRYHYGRDVDERAVFEAMFAAGDQEQIRRVGFSLLDMKRYLEGHGYLADGFRLTLDDLEKGRAPAIIMVDTGGYRHFVVLKGMDADRVLIGDPAVGLKVYSREEFAALWNGVAFMLRSPGDHFNETGDWTKFATLRPDTAMPANSLASFTQQLPPIYQISTTFPLDGYLR